MATNAETRGWSGLFAVVIKRREGKRKEAKLAGALADLSRDGDKCTGGGTAKPNCRDSFQARPAESSRRNCQVGSFQLAC